MEEMLRSMKWMKSNKMSEGLCSLGHVRPQGDLKKQTTQLKEIQCLRLLYFYMYFLFDFNE